ncbi:MAG: peptidogalycan biosysnthesis protein [Syntrophobacteraceae bacterium]|nr:peptidogalycan biosysnthesis protein [Syntrophobacteraceae bacterium]
MEKRVKIVSRIEDVAPEQWNALAVNASPMLEFEYLHALEKSGSVSTQSGYTPVHLALQYDSRIVALAPLYQRDRAWVEFGDGGLLEFLSEITGLPFGSGLVGSLPYTPVPGYDFLAAPGLDARAIFAELLEKIDEIAMERGLSTSRFHFVAPESALHSLLGEHGYLRLSTPHLVWFNRGYRSFDDFLLSFKSTRRTKIKHEWRSIRDSGIELSMVPGTSAPPSFYRDLYLLYRRTWIKHMGPGIRPFLNESFFSLLGENFGNRCGFSVAQRSGNRVGMALFYDKDQKLYGRYWGSFQEVPFLHFATCYYYPVSFAIEKGIGMVDPGFGGEHKTLRGFEESHAYHYVKFYDDNQRRIAYAVLDQMRGRQPSK